LAQHGIELIGCIPFSELLANPSLELIETHLEGELLAGAADPGSIIGHVAIGAMRADHAVPYLRDRTLLITPGDREDMLEVALDAYRASIGLGQRPRVRGIVLTGGFRPSELWLGQLRDAGLFTYLVETDTYRTAQDVQDILVKTHPTDTEKIATIKEIVGRSLDPEPLLARV
jgi:phosphate acetyltransferase